MNRRLRLFPALTVLVLAVSAAAATGAGTAAASAAKATPSFCTAAGPIPASAISSTLDLRNCPIEGRLVVRSVGTAHMGLHVPPPGRGVGAYALTKTGDYVFTATNVNGRLTISTSVPTTRTPEASATAVRTTATAAADPACSELGVAYTGKFWVKTLKWYYNQSTVSRAGLNGITTRDEIRQANSNITLGINNCGFSEQGFNAYGAYQGTTSLYANINSSAQCTSRFPDGQNTNSWGPFDSSAAGTLALTCWAWNTGSSLLS